MGNRRLCPVIPYITIPRTIPIDEEGNSSLNMSHAYVPPSSHIRVSTGIQWHMKGPFHGGGGKGVGIAGRKCKQTHTHRFDKKRKGKKGQNLACANGQGKTGENRKSVGDRRQTTFSTFFAPKKVPQNKYWGKKHLLPHGRGMEGRILLRDCERTLNRSFLSLSEKEKAAEGSSNFSFFLWVSGACPLL